MASAYIIDAVRTPIGRYGGALSGVRPDDLLAHVIRALLDRNPQVDPARIEDVIAGCANGAGEDNRNVARMAVLLAGLPVSVGGNTVNRLCASGLQAIMDAGRSAMCGDGEFFIAGGVESMSRAPFVMGKAESAFARNPEIFDTTLGWRFINPRQSEKYPPYTMGETAENVADRYSVGREAQDRFAVTSQERYAAAHKAGHFTDELVAVGAAHGLTLGKGKPESFDTDEHPRLSPLEKLATLKPAFKKDGTVTAGNSSGINDGASAVLIASEEAVQKYGLNPLARIAGMAVAGVDPAVMGMGPVPASRKALERAGISAAELDLVELNEAFAAQAIPCMDELGLDPEKVNVNGGAIALGHPLGSSGARISATLLHELKRRNGRYGLATMCVGVGQGAAIVYENLRRDR